MKKGICGLVAAFSLAVAVFFGVYSGPAFMQLLSGPIPLTGSFQEADGTFAAYEVVWPVASYGTEYYSGDPDRISKYGYIVYDEERLEFFHVVVPDRVNSSFSNLLRKANQDDASRSQVTPVLAKGSVKPMDDSQVERVLKVLTGSDSKSTRAMDEIAFAQTNWYSMEYGKIEGFGSFNIWLMMITAAFNGIIFLVALKGLLKKERKESEAEILEKGFSGSKMDHLLTLQRLWLEPWNATMGSKNVKIAFLGVALGIGIPTGIGLLVGMTLPGVAALHLPLGLLIGEVLGGVGWMGQKFSFNTDKTLKSFRKSVEKILPSKEACEEFAEDILEGAKEGAFRERGKDEMLWTAVGDRYWAVFRNNGVVNLVDSSMVEKVETCTETSEFYVGRVTTIYTRYTAKIYYKNSTRKKGCDYYLGFGAEETLGFVIAQIKKHLGDAIEITAQ